MQGDTGSTELIIAGSGLLAVWFGLQIPWVVDAPCRRLSEPRMAPGQTLLVPGCPRPSTIQHRPGAGQLSLRRGEAPGNPPSPALSLLICSWVMAWSSPPPSFILHFQTPLMESIPVREFYKELRRILLFNFNLSTQYSPWQRSDTKW